MPWFSTATVSSPNNHSSCPSFGAIARATTVLNVAGVVNANEMGYWQTLTPDELLGRVNATRRSINRTMAAFGALIGGLLVGLIGDRLTLVAAVVTFLAAALVAALSPLRETPESAGPEVRL